MCSKTAEKLFKDYKKQPFFVLNDEAYHRMVQTLRDGNPFVKSYMGTCCHKSKEECKCTYFNNYLNEDGDMVRDVDGVIKPVLNTTMYMTLMTESIKRKL